MQESELLEQVPRGATVEGVNQAIVGYLLGSGRDMHGVRVLDIPCGRGELISTLRKTFPGIDVRGCDLEKPGCLSTEDFAAVDASRPFSVFPERPFDYVVSVSGVMEFDNTLQFFQMCHRHLRENGELIVTNDNFVALRDRISYLLYGTVTTPYKLFVAQGQTTWKVIPIHNLVRILQDAGFRIREIEYIKPRGKDWRLLPLALLLYPLQRFYIRHRSASRQVQMPLAEKFAMYPFRSLLSRHYVIHAERDSVPGG